MPLGGEMVNEIIVIRAADPDGSMFRAIMDVLRDRKAEGRWQRFCLER